MVEGFKSQLEGVLTCQKSDDLSVKTKQNKTKHPEMD